MGIIRPKIYIYMNIDEILQEILFKKGFYKEINVKPMKVEVWKNRFKQNKLTFEKKEEILILAGYEKIQDSLYRKINEEN